MTDKPETSRQDRDMVRRALEARQAPDGEAPRDPTVDPMVDQPPDDMALAAYLDGTLSDRERDRVEAGLTASTEAAELWLAARESLAASAPEVPGSVVRRAQGLVSAPAAGRTAARPLSLGLWLSGLADIFAPALGSLPRPVGAALATLALVVVSASGFELGRTGYGNLAGGPLQAETDDDLGFGDPADDVL